MTHRQVITSLITLIALLKGKVALNICMKASFSFILAKLTLKDKRNKKLDPFKFILTLPGCSVSHMRKLFHIYISIYIYHHIDIYISLSHQRGIRASVRVHVCFGPGGPLVWRGGSQHQCESHWCCEMVLRCENDVLESSEPPAAAPTSACSRWPIRAKNSEPWRIGPLGNLFRESWWRSWNKSQAPAPQKYSCCIHPLHPPHNLLALIC